MTKSYYKYIVCFLQPVDCFGEDITESVIVAENDEKMTEIVKNSYFVEKNIFYVKNKKEVTLFNPIYKTVNPVIDVDLLEDLESVN
jgi:hypothetical protein